MDLKKKNSFISQWDLSFQQIRGAPNMYTICHLTTVMPWPTVPNSPRLKAHGRFWDTLFEFSQCNWFNVFYVWPLPLTTSRNWPFHSCFGFAPGATAIRQPLWRALSKWSQQTDSIWIKFTCTFVDLISSISRPVPKGGSLNFPSSFNALENKNSSPSIFF